MEKKETLEERLKKPQQFEIDEIHQIIKILRGGNGKNDGDYRSTHLGTILEYLSKKERENKSLTLQKLALMIGMSQRQIRENYVDGLIAFGIINLTQKCDEWYWVGISAIQDKQGELKKHDS
jgi:hypothetical protein